MTNGRFPEFHDRQRVVQIGSVYFDTKDKTITGDIETDTTAILLEAHTVSRWMCPDPLAEKYYHISPYAFCGNNPIKFIDPDGLSFGDFLDKKGRLIGSDGINDGKLYVLKTSESSFGSADNNSLVNGAGVSNKDLKDTQNFIKDNSGNTQAFQSNSIAYDNSVEIVGSQQVRQDMVNEISRDNGKGGADASNNREYGGSLQNGGVVTAQPGPVSAPGQDAQISLPVGVPTFHSHPSGSSTTINNPSSNNMGSVSSFGGSTTTRAYTQTPSPADIRNAGSHTNYVFGRSGNGNVYIYNSSGVQAVIPMKHFVVPKH